jgi:glucose/arabinose dehydrogenase
MRARVWIGLLAGCLLALALAPRAGAAVSLQPVGDFDQPMYVTAPPGDQRLFVVEREGTIQVLHDGTRTQFLDISDMVDTSGERGLLSMAFDPGYASNGLFYVFYNDDGSAGAALGDIHVDEYHVGSNPNVADPASRRPVLTVARNTSASNHNGGQLQFGKDGLLYISVGDAANGSNAQNPSNLNGKILRINPHVGGGGPQVWSLGLRNPWRFSFDHLTGDIVIADVGSGSREEIDFAPAATGLGGGFNYGWPGCEGFSGFPDDCLGTVAPVLDYAHSDPCNAVIGGYVYRGSHVPELAGRYVYNDLCHPTIRSAVLGLPLATGDRSEGIGSDLDSPTSFGEDASCELYVAEANSVVKIVSTSPPAVAPACAVAPASQPIAKKRKCKKRSKKKRAAEAKKKKHKKKCKKRKKRKKKRSASI